MITILLSTIYVVYSQTYVLNPEEIKIFDYQLSGMEKYDVQQQKFVEHIAGSFDDDVIVKQVISPFMPFDSQQRIDILAMTPKNTYTVYTITYDKILNANYKLTSNQLQNVISCTSIAYIDNQFVVDCSDTQIKFLLQNGTIVSYQGNVVKKFDSISTFYGGIVGISPNLMTIFNENLEMERQYPLEFIQLQFTNENAYVLQENQVCIYTRDNGIETYEHHCETTPQFMTVTADFLYVQCETLRIVTTGDIEELPQVASSLSATTNYVILNNSYIYDSFGIQEYYKSETSLYPINFDDYAIKFNNRQIIIGQVVGYYLITESKQKTFEIGDQQFLVVNQGLQALNQSSPQAQYSTYFITDYVAGPDAKIAENGALTQPLKYDLENNFLDRTLHNSFIYQSTKIVLIYSEKSMLNASICDVVINDKVFPSCEPPKIIEANLPSDTSNIQGIYDFGTNQVVICYQSKNQLHIYIDSETHTIIENVINYSLRQERLIIMYKDKTTVNYLSDQQFEEVLSLEITARLAMLCINVNNNFHQYIYLVDQQNNLITITSSINGWYNKQIQSFKEQIVNLSYLNNQLFVITDKLIYVQEEGILRGKFSLNLAGTKHFLQTLYHFYIYNSTHIYQYQGFKELSLSSLLKQVINFQNQSQFLALSYNEFELMIIDNQLQITDSLQTFQPNSIVESDTYSRFNVIEVTFANSFNQQVSTKVKVIGDRLKLEVKDFESSNLNLQFDENNTCTVDQTALFSGPISEIKIDNGQEIGFEIQQRVAFQTKQPQWLSTNVIDLIDIGNGTTVVYNDSSLLLCQSDKCQSILNNTASCISLITDISSYYLICPKQIYSASKEKPTQLTSNSFLPDPYAVNWKFHNESIMAIITRNNVEAYILIYENYKLKEQKQMDDLMDFEFNDTSLILLTEKQVLIADFNLEIHHTYDLLKDMTIQEQNQALTFTTFANIFRIDADQYIISTTSAPIFQVYLHPSSIEIVVQFTNIPNTYPVQTYVLESQILVVVSISRETSQIQAAFYDYEDKPKSSLIIPYFNIIKLGGKFSLNHYTRQYDSSQIILLNENNLKSVYGINDNIVIKALSNSQKLNALTAYDFDAQSTVANIDLGGEPESNVMKDWMIALYVLAGVVGAVLLLIGFRFIRRFCLVRRLKFVEEKGSEFKSEYI